MDSNQQHPDARLPSKRPILSFLDRMSGGGRRVRPGLGRRWVGGVLMVVLAASLVGLLGCATTVIPPRDVNDPVAVYLADYGRHSSLVLPRNEESMIEFAFGEWRWFALNDTGVLAAFRALCWGTTGTLGSRVIPTADRGWLEEAFPGVDVFQVQVERESAGALVERLENRWLQHQDAAVFNAAYDFHFVPIDQRYHVFRNCNPVVAGWLRDLDCRVRGPALLSNWRLRPAESGF